MVRLTCVNQGNTDAFGVEGTIIDAKIFTRKGADKDLRSQEIEEDAIAQLTKDRNDEIRILTETMKKDVAKIVVGKTLAGKIGDAKKKTLVKKGEKITKEIFAELPYTCWKDISLADSDTAEEKLTNLLSAMERKIDFIRAHFEQKLEKIKASDELPPGVIKMVKIYIAIAGLSAALPGVIASKTDKPVIGVPVSGTLNGLDALLAIAQMPKGVPVACVGVDNGDNAAWLAIRILNLQKT